MNESETAPEETKETKEIIEGLIKSGSNRSKPPRQTILSQSFFEATGAPQEGSEQSQPSTDSISDNRNALTAPTVSISPNDSSPIKKPTSAPPPPPVTTKTSRQPHHRLKSTVERSSHHKSSHEKSSSHGRSSLDNAKRDSSNNPIRSRTLSSINVQEKKMQNRKRFTFNESDNSKQTVVPNEKSALTEEIVERRNC
eukprot:TRINITY_DN5284_c0_g1_i3.p1 TRINITY_DN5284_c0_g1~~TRINITY_DN5284_c0_g1_i3.p1  ORF type:complete len:197 (+),score=41.60 TRINITY_DN5284_c0_g1_i3:234-824(+)